MGRREGGREGGRGEEEELYGQNPSCLPPLLIWDYVLFSSLLISSLSWGMKRAVLCGAVLVVLLYVCGGGGR